MIFFKKLRFKNILSYGNQFTEINLSKNKTTLIVGKNGSGKSTFLDALTYVIYGKPYRKINKPQLINSTNKKELLVEVEFNVNSDGYLIRRGMQPNIFEIYKNGNLINQDSKNLDYQEKLEKNILKLNLKSFLQIAVLGSATYVPFMELTTQQRREVIEDLLDLKIFSIMNILLRDKVSDNKENILINKNSYKLIEEKILLAKDYHKKLKNVIEENLRKKNEEIKKIKIKIEYTLKRVKVLEQQICPYLDKEKLLNNKIKKLTEIKNNYKYELRNLHADIKFLENHDNCPTCKQDIDDNFKKLSIVSKNKALNSISEKIENVEFDEDKCVTLSNKILTIKSKNDFINKKIMTLNIEISHLNKNILKLEEELSEELSEETTENISNLIKNKKEYIKKIKELINDKEIYSMVSILLKDSGIKTKIIKQYIPVMNTMINKHLSLMDFPCQFELDETFSETIKSRFRDEFSYSSFSEGEKLRITIAILFTWRAISKIRNSVSINLLLFDEVLDGSLDANGLDEFIKIIQGLTDGSNVFIVSHKIDTISDKFDHMIEFEKVRGFSKMKEL